MATYRKTSSVIYYEIRLNVELSNFFSTVNSVPDPPRSLITPAINLISG